MSDAVFHPGTKARANAVAPHQVWLTGAVCFRNPDPAAFLRGRHALSIGLSGRMENRNGLYRSILPPVVYQI